MDWIELDWRALRHLTLLDDESISNVLHIIIANATSHAPGWETGLPRFDLDTQKGKRSHLANLESDFSWLTESVLKQSRGLLMGFNTILSKGRLVQKLEQCLGIEVWALVESSANDRDAGEVGYQHRGTWRAERTERRAERGKGVAKVVELVSDEAVQDSRSRSFNMWQLRRPPTLDHLTAVFSSDPDNEVSSWLIEAWAIPSLTFTYPPYPRLGGQFLRRCFVPRRLLH